MSSPPPSVDFLEDGPARSSHTLILAHGAGAPMDSPFLARIAAGVAAEGLRVLRFEFPYMAERRRSGKQGGPNGAEKLLASWRTAIECAGRDPRHLVIGGKSLGGRVASMVADDARIGGLVCLGYPFHPPDKPDQLRTAHLAELTTPTLVLQGERDRFGNRAEVSDYRLSSAIQVEWVPDGNHSFKPRIRSGHTEDDNLDFAIAQTASFVGQVLDAGESGTP